MVTELDLVCPGCGAGLSGAGIPWVATGAGMTGRRSSIASVISTRSNKSEFAGFMDSGSNCSGLSAEPPENTEVWRSR